MHNITYEIIEKILIQILDYSQSDKVYTEHDYDIQGHHDGVMNKYLGLIRCRIS